MRHEGELWKLAIATADHNVQQELKLKTARVKRDRRGVVRGLRGVRISTIGMVSLACVACTARDTGQLFQCFCGQASSSSHSSCSLPVFPKCQDAGHGAWFVASSWGGGGPLHRQALWARPKKKELEPFAFEADLGDHCETPGIAYKHILPLLREIATATYPDQHWRVASKGLRIYDPYYCQGSVKKRLARLGFESVYNENEDFYKACDEKRVPKFDVLVTNPPFSVEEHFSFILDFALKSGKPWFMILPVTCLANG